MIIQRIQGITAQSVVGAQFGDDNAGLIFLQQQGQAAKSSGGCFATDTGIYHLDSPISFFKIHREFCNPALFQRHTIGCTDTIAQD